MKNKSLVIGYLKSGVLININGESIGEAPHVTFQVIFPIAKEIYVSDTVGNIKEDLMEALYRTGYLKNKHDYIISETDNIIHVSRKEEVYV